MLHLFSVVLLSEIQQIEIMTTTEIQFHLVEIIKGSEYNIFTGTEEECMAEMIDLRERYHNTNEMYISINRFD